MPRPARLHGEKEAKRSGSFQGWRGTSLQAVQLPVGALRRPLSREDGPCTAGQQESGNSSLDVVERARTAWRSEIAPPLVGISPFMRLCKD